MSEQYGSKSDAAGAGLPPPPPPTSASSLLPPPPIMAAKINNASAGGGGGVGGVGAGGAVSQQPTTSLPLPPPPALKVPPPRLPPPTTGVNGAASTSSLPPPPHVATMKPPSLPPPPSLGGVSSANVTATGQPSTTAGGVGIDNATTAAAARVHPSASEGFHPLEPAPAIPTKTTFDANSAAASGAISIAADESRVHATSEQIPPLHSAPNSSGVQSLFSPSTDSDDFVGETPAAMDEQRQRSQPADENMGSGEYTQPLSRPPTIPPPPNAATAAKAASGVVNAGEAQSIQAAPSSGSSWSAWAGTLTEKAGQLAYNTVETAGNTLLSVQRADSFDNPVVGGVGVNRNASMASHWRPPPPVGIRVDERIMPSAAAPEMFASPGVQEGTTPGHPAAAVDSTFASPGVTTAGAPVLPVDSPNLPQKEGTSTKKKDNFANLFRETQQTQKFVPNGEEVPRMEHKQSVASVEHPELQQQTSSYQHQQQESATSHQQQPDSLATQQSPNTPLRRRAQSNPPVATLASRQSRLSILILPTASAQDMAAKNGVSLTDLFRVYGNSSSQPGRRQQQLGGNDQRDSSLEPMLPPFRSANRSMALRWENLEFNFLSNGDLDSLPVNQSEGEKALGEAAKLWEEDGSEGGEDDEMKRLEQRVVDALAEDGAVERARRMDGVPSMTSRSPSEIRDSKPQFGSADGSDDSDKQTEHQEQPFPPRPEELLQASAKSALALTASLTPSWMNPSPPWLRRFRHTLDHVTNGTHHELLLNPSVVVLCASTSEPHFVNCLAELANVHHLPRPYHDGRYDPNGLRREFLLIHDVISGPQDFDEKAALAQMRDRFGFGCCSVLRINSLIPREVGISDGYQSAGEGDEWEGSVPGSMFTEEGVLSENYSASLPDETSKVVIRGTCLSPSDKRAIRRYVANMVATGLVPAIERRIAHLNATVNNAKKGVKNVIKSLWRKPVKGVDNLLGVSSAYSGDGGGGEGKQIDVDPVSSPAGGVKYRFDTIESQSRLLADTLFLMRDYEAALSVYKLVKDDYKHDKAHLHYASVQEMIVLCMHMIDPTGKDGRFTQYDVQHSIETALYSYTRVSEEDLDSSENPTATGVRPGKAPYATRLATRFCLAISATPSLCENRNMEIADLLASASSHETPLGAAVLLEQSSAHYYQAGMLRKYAFHMLMAGHMFRSAGNQERHAFRSFAASLYVYHGENWGELRSHLRSALAAQLYGMGRYSLSMQFYCKLIGGMLSGGGRVSVRSQQKFLNHILAVCREYGQEALISIDRMKSDEDGALKGLHESVLRQIEISNIGFPHVHDDSIGICVDGTGESDGSTVSLGRSDSLLTSQSSQGDEAVWQDMTNCAEAELRSDVEETSDNNGTDTSTSNENNVVPSAENESLIAKVISEIDKEERDAEYRERSKRKGGSSVPEVRSTHEPLSVSFTMKNPLGVEIELIDMQLVANCENDGGLVHTNEYAVVPKDNGVVVNKKKKTWTFHGSDDEFHSPEFTCELRTASSEVSSFIIPIDEDCDPHFVVTKPSMKMGPNSDTIVSLKLCPISEGSLRILGVRFRLMGEVWICHKFDPKGSLLQDTRLNRSRRIRGESLMLKSKVEEKMPSLKVSLTPDEGTQSTVLQGQTSQWKLKLSNVGYAPATNVVLKTNAPWLNLTQAEDKTMHADEDAPTSFCIGPSGTLMRVPLKTSEETIGDTLQPGETVEMPVSIRTSGGGRQDFYMLFRYELANDTCATSSASSPKSRHRWARKLLSVPVYPSITMSASIMPSYSHKGQHILSVELMNYRSDRDSKLDINLNEIRIASRHFEVKRLLGQVDSEDLTHSRPLGIEWQDRVTLHYLVVPTEEGDNKRVTFSKLSFSSQLEPMPNERFPLTDFMCRERAHEEFTSILHSHRIEKERLAAEQEKEGQPRHVAQIRREKTSNITEQESNITSDSPTHPTSLASLCPVKGASNINIICCWSAAVADEGKDMTIKGQHHLRDLLVRPLTKSKGCPLALTAKYAPNAVHNFEENGPLVEDLEITIRNRLIETDVDFEFALDHADIEFIGTTCFNWSLEGGGEISVPLKARIYSGGVYNLQSIRLTVLKAGNAVPYLFPLQWMMSVDDSSYE